MTFKLPRHDRLHVQAAEGWLGLGDYASANGELEQITPKLRAHPDVLQIRTKIYVAAEQWEMVAETAGKLQKVQPRKPFGVIHRAHALRKLGKAERACDLLLEVSERFNQDWQFAYQFACCCAALGDKTNAWKWAKHAVDMGPTGTNLKALDDPDLEPIWVDMSEI